MTEISGIILVRFFPVRRSRESLLLIKEILPLHLAGLDQFNNLNEIGQEVGTRAFLVSTFTKAAPLQQSWNLSAIQVSPTDLSLSFRRPSLHAIQKPSTMPARTNISESSSCTGESNNSLSNRWQFNGTGQLVDSVASEWDLAQ
jgi:hypothetical protein